MTAPACPAVRAGLLLGLSALMACRRTSPEEELDRKRLAECDAGHCLEVKGNDPHASLGVDAARLAAGSGHILSCILLMRPAAAAGVEMRVPTSPGSLVLVDGRVAKVEHCDEDYQQEDRRWGVQHSRAVLRVDLDAYAGLVPDPSHLFLPLNATYAALDDVCLDVHAPWPRPDTPSLESVSLDVWPGGYECRHDPRYDVGHKDAYPNLRAGETFAWGTHTAEVIRIVNDQPPVRGWIELVVH